MEDGSRKYKYITFINININKNLELIFYSIVTAIIVKPEIQQYWSTDPILATPFFSQHMSRNRFKLIHKFFHFNNNMDRPHDCDDKLFKVRPIIITLLDIFRKNYIYYGIAKKAVCFRPLDLADTVMGRFSEWIQTQVPFPLYGQPLQPGVTFFNLILFLFPFSY